MPTSEEVTSRRCSKPVEEYTEDDIESWRMEALKKYYPERYAERLQLHKVHNRRAYDREMKKRKISTSTGESRTPEPSRREARITGVKNGPFVRRLMDIPENKTSKGKSPILPGYKGDTSKARKKTSSSDMEISSEKEEEDDDGTEDALFVRKKKTQAPPRKPEKEYQIRCLHCKSYILIPRSQMRKVAPPEGWKSSHKNH